MRKRLQEVAMPWRQPIIWWKTLRSTFLMTDSEQSKFIISGAVAVHKLPIAVHDEVAEEADSGAEMELRAVLLDQSGGFQFRQVEILAPMKFIAQQAPHLLLVGQPHLGLVPNPANLEWIYFHFCSGTGIGFSFHFRGEARNGFKFRFFGNVTTLVKLSYASFTRDDFII